MPAGTGNTGFTVPAVPGLLSTDDSLDRITGAIIFDLPPFGVFSLFGVLFGGILFDFL